ncbi:MAG: hypothetical protein IPM52_10040 [Bacteroidetes bacterium]|nr:hypothetical protein [Bacteroidota bacterium]
MKLTLNLNCTQSDSYRKLEEWIENIADKYNLSSTYHSSVLILLDEIFRLGQERHQSLIIHASTGEEGMSFEVVATDETNVETTAQFRDDEYLMQLLSDLCSRHGFQDNNLFFGLASEAFPINKSLQRQVQLKNYFKGNIEIEVGHDTISEH